MPIISAEEFFRGGDINKSRVVSSLGAFSSVKKPEEPKEPSFLGKVARETVRPLAKLGTSLVNTAQIATGQEETQPFSGEFLGEVERIGKGFDVTKGFSPENIKALKDAAKTGVDIGLLISGGGGASGVAKSGIKQGIIQGIKTGAKTGATIGGIGGASTGLEEGATLGSTLKNTAIGAVTGAGTGAVIGGASGVASAGVKATKNLATKTIEKGGIVTKTILGKPKNEAEFVLDLVSPKATDKVKQSAIAQGRVTEQGIIRPSKILPSKRDITLADSVKGVVSMKNSVPKNVNALETTIDKINNKVKTYVKKNKVPFNTKQLTTQLNKGKNELKVIFASDKQAEKTYNAVVKEFIKHVGKKDTAGLLDARQAFDKIPAIRKLLESQGLGENVKREIVLTARQKANGYIASLLPKGNEFRADLLKESHMLEVLGNIAEKNTKEIGLNKIQSLTAKYPILKWGASIGLGAGGIGVGSAAIGSLD